MASCSQPRIRSYKTSGAVKKFSFVKFDSASNSKSPTVVQCESAQAIGIAQNDADAASGDTVEVALPGGGAKLAISGTVALGNSLKATTNGAGIATTTAGDHVCAWAVEGGVATDIIGVEVCRGEKYNADAT